MEKYSLDSPRNTPLVEGGSSAALEAIPSNLSEGQARLSIPGKMSQQGNQPPGPDGEGWLSEPTAQAPSGQTPRLSRGLVLSALKGSNRLDKNFPSRSFPLCTASLGPLSLEPWLGLASGRHWQEVGERGVRVLVSWPSLSGVAVSRPHPLPEGHSSASLGVPCDSPPLGLPDLEGNRTPPPLQYHPLSPFPCLQLCKCPFISISSNDLIGGAICLPSGP